MTGPDPVSFKHQSMPSLVFLIRSVPDHLSRSGQRASGALWRACLEAILESPGDRTHVSHAAGADGLSPLRLLAPVVCYVSA